MSFSCFVTKTFCAGSSVSLLGWSFSTRYHSLFLASGPTDKTCWLTGPVTASSQPADDQGSQEDILLHFYSSSSGHSLYLGHDESLQLLKLDLFWQRSRSVRLVHRQGDRAVCSKLTQTSSDRNLYASRKWSSSMAFAYMPFMDLIVLTTIVFRFIFWPYFSPARSSISCLR